LGTLWIAHSQEHLPVQSVDIF